MTTIISPNVRTSYFCQKNFAELKKMTWWYTICTGKSFSEALILESVNPQYDDRLGIELQVQYKKNPSSEHVV